VSPKHTINASSAASEIAAELRNHYQMEPSVQCPSGVPDKKGQTFTCSAVLDAQKVDLEATVTRTGGTFTVNPTSAILVVATVVPEVQASLARSASVPAAVDCGTRTLLVIPVKGTFTCQATFAGNLPRTVTVTVTNIEGNLQIHLPAVKKT
jgi:hypothetical protein